MLRSKASKLAIVAAVGLLSVGTVVSARAQHASATEWGSGKVIYLGSLPGTTNSAAWGINNLGQVVGSSYNGNQSYPINDAYATEWSGGQIIELGSYPSAAYGINDSGQVVGVDGGWAAEWSGGQTIDLGGLPGSTGSLAFAVNDAGQAVGYSVVDRVHRSARPDAGSRRRDDRPRRHLGQRQVDHPQRDALTDARRRAPLKRYPSS